MAIHTHLTHEQASELSSLIIEEKVDGFALKESGLITVYKINSEGKKQERDFLK